MSAANEAPENPESKEEYIEVDDVAEVVGDDVPSEEEMIDAHDHDHDETIEIDMRNNSKTYFDQHTDSVYLIASHPSLPLVCSGGGDNVAYLWTTTHTPPRLAAKLTEHTESVVAGGFSSNGKFLVLGDMSGRLVVWKSNNTGEKWTLLSNTQEIEEIVHIAFHPTLPMFAVSASDGSIWCYEISDDVVNVAVLNAHSLPTTATNFIPSEDLQPKLFSISEDGLLILWDVYGSRAIYTLGPSHLHGDHPWVSLALSPTAKTVAVGSMDGLVVLVKLADGAVLRTIDTTMVKPETPKREVEGLDNNVKDGEGSGESEAEEEEGNSVEGLAWSDKTNILATGNVEGVVVLWDTVTWRPRSHFQLEDSVTKLQFVPNTRLLVVSGMDGSLAEYDVISSEKVWDCHGHSEGVLGFAIQGEGSRLISAGDDNVCLVFEKQAQE